MVFISNRAAKVQQFFDMRKLFFGDPLAALIFRQNGHNYSNVLIVGKLQRKCKKVAKK